MHRQERVLGFMFAAVLAVVGLWPLWTGAAPSVFWLVGAGVLAAIAVLRPGVFTPALKVWMPFAHLLGRINTYLLLAIAFFVFIVPVALIFRLTGRDRMQRKLRTSDDWWVARKGEQWSPESFRNQF